MLTKNVPIDLSQDWNGRMYYKGVEEASFDYPVVLIQVGHIVIATNQHFETMPVVFEEESGYWIPAFSCNFCGKANSAVILRNNDNGIPIWACDGCI